MRCKVCGSNENVEITAILLEPLKPKNDGTTARTAGISDDAIFECMTCERKVAVKWSVIRLMDEVVF